MSKIIERPEVRQEDLPPLEPDKPEGPVAAALIAGGIGCLALGFFTTLAEANAGAKTWLQWSDRVGPLSGLVALGVLGTFPTFFQAFASD